MSILRPFSGKMGAKCILRPGAGHRAQGAFYPRPKLAQCDNILNIFTGGYIFLLVKFAKKNLNCCELGIFLEVKFGLTNFTLCKRIDISQLWVVHDNCHIFMDVVRGVK